MRKWVNVVLEIIMKVLEGCIIIAIIVLIYYNLKNNNLSDFLIAPLYSLVTVLVAIVFAFFFTQRKNDERKVKENAELLLDKIQHIISDERFCVIQKKEDVDFLLIQIRALSNKIDCFKKIQGKLGITKEINYIIAVFNQYEEYIGNHNTDILHLANSYTDLHNKIVLIDDKCDHIKIQLYY